MFNFWYSERCTRPIKLSVIIGTCVVVLIASKQLQLSTTLTGFSLALGILLHFIHAWSLRIGQNHPYKKYFQLLFLSIPIVGVLLLSLSLAATDLISFLVLGGAVTGFYTDWFFLGFNRRT